MSNSKQQREKTIRVMCPYHWCHWVQKLAETLRGHSVVCPRCSTHYRVPGCKPVMVG